MSGTIDTDLGWTTGWRNGAAAAIAAVVAFGGYVYVGTVTGFLGEAMEDAGNPEFMDLFSEALLGGTNATAGGEGGFLELLALLAADDIRGAFTAFDYSMDPVIFGLGILLYLLPPVALYLAGKAATPGEAVREDVDVLQVTSGVTLGFLAPIVVIGFVFLPDDAAVSLTATGVIKSTVVSGVFAGMGVLGSASNYDRSFPRLDPRAIGYGAGVLLVGVLYTYSQLDDPGREDAGVWETLATVYAGYLEEAFGTIGRAFFSDFTAIGSDVDDLFVLGVGIIALAVGLYIRNDEATARDGGPVSSPFRGWSVAKGLLVSCVVTFVAAIGVILVAGASENPEGFEEVATEFVLISSFVVVNVALMLFVVAIVTAIATDYLYVSFLDSGSGSPGAAGGDGDGPADPADEVPAADSDPGSTSTVAADDDGPTESPETAR